MKKLPRIYRSDELSPKDHNQKYCSFYNQIKEKNITKELDSIFDSFSSLYQKKVELKTTKKIYHTFLISRTKNYVMTMEKEIIPIKDIIEINQ